MHIEFKYRYYENEKDYEDYQLEMDNVQDSKIAYRLDEVGMSFTLQNKNNVTEVMLHFMLLMKQHLFLIRKWWSISWNNPIFLLQLIHLNRSIR